MHPQKSEPPAGGDADATVRSRRHVLVRSLRRLAGSARARDRERAFVADGVRLLEEAVRRGAAIDVAMVSPRLDRHDRGRELRRRLAERAARFVRATDDVVAAVVGAVRHQGAVARVRGLDAPVEALLGTDGSPAVVLACGIQDPGNLGGLLRAAAAAGAAGVIAAEGTADAWNPKAVRASAGAVFHLPLVRRAAGLDALQLLAAGGCVRRAAVVSGGTPYSEVDWRRPFVLIVGGEGPGLPEELLRASDERVTIPMAREIESLNVLSAATLLLFEAARQRHPAGR